MDLTTKLNTSLSADEQKGYDTWVKAQSKVEGRNLNSDLFNYDMKGYWKDVVASGNAGAKEAGHYPDTYKKPNHPTFSSESKYSDEEHPGGAWDESGAFHPSSYNLTVTPLPLLRRYFDRFEPGAGLVLPASGGTH
jgi:hypothetical protein